MHISHILFDYKVSYKYTLSSVAKIDRLCLNQQENQPEEVVELQSLLSNIESELNNI